MSTCLGARIGESMDKMSLPSEAFSLLSLLLAQQRYHGTFHVQMLGFRIGAFTKNMVHAPLSATVIAVIIY